MARPRARASHAVAPAAAGLGGEGFGIVYLEAGLHGIPAVGGNVGGARDAVVDGETGLLVDPTDHLAVAGAATELLRRPGARAGRWARPAASTPSASPGR